MELSGSKTPVSVLNEYLIRKGVLPKYDLVMNGCRMQKPCFAYVLQCGGDVVCGEGRSKQEAKHQAARKMLELLKLSFENEYTEDVNQLVVPYENNIGYNAVGELAEYCRRNCYPEVIYETISEAGPPHARTFTMKCCVSKLSTIGIARTKKEAKHIASHKMVMQLQQEAGEEPMAVALPNKKSKSDDIQIIPEAPRGTVVYQPQPLLYKDFCNAYLGLDEKSETIANILKDWNIVTLENACKLVLDISNELGVNIVIEKIIENNAKELPLDLLEKKSEILTNDSETTFIFITMKLYPSVVGVENNIPGAALSLLNFLKELII